MTAEFTADISTQVPTYALSNPAGDGRGTVPIARTAKVLLTEGIALARRRELERAIALFTQALSLTISDPAIRLKSHYHRGCALSGVSRYGEAIADFTQVIQFGESEDASMGARAFAAVPATKLTELYIHRGNAYRHAGHYQLAATDLESGVQRSRGSAQSYGARGLLRLDQGEFEGAIADFSQALTVHPTFVQCHLWRGFARLRSDDYAHAEADLSRAIEAIPACAEAYNHRGVARFYLNSFAAARTDFNQAIQLNPRFTEAYNNRGNLRQLLGEPAGAAADYDRAIALNPHLSELYFNRAASISAASGSASGDSHSANTLAEVAADYDQIAGLSLNSAALYRTRAQVRFQQGHFSAAVADYTSALALSPSAYAYAHRGIAYLALGQLKPAQADLDAAIALAPDYGRPYGDRAHLRFKANDLTGAIADTHKALALANSQNPQLKRIYATLCLTHFCLKDTDQARQDFGQLIAMLQSSSHTSKDATSIGSL